MIAIKRTPGGYNAQIGHLGNSLHRNSIGNIFEAYYGYLKQRFCLLLLVPEKSLNVQPALKRQK